MAKLILVNGLFAAILVIFLIAPITSNWAWLGFIFVWCWCEGLLARDPSVKWWQMLLVFVALGAIDFVIVSSL